MEASLQWILKEMESEDKQMRTIHQKNEERMKIMVQESSACLSTALKHAGVDKVKNPGRRRNIITKVSKTQVSKDSQAQVQTVALVREKDSGSRV